jgi:hypothetical protein
MAIGAGRHSLTIILGFGQKITPGRLWIAECGMGNMGTQARY